LDPVIKLSALPHTWLIDIDGTIFEHNGHLSGEDKILPGVKQFWESIPASDVIILMTARSREVADLTESALQHYGLRFNQIIYGLPPGERILVNDRKPSGLNCALALAVTRDAGMLGVRIDTDPEL